MGDKKRIDRLFQERFKDFEAQPDNAVWENIEAKLNEKKKKRRVIPIWWRYAGVAAILLLAFTLGSYIYNSSVETSTPQIVDTKPAETDTTTNSTLNKNNTIGNTNATNVTSDSKTGGNNVASPLSNTEKQKNSTIDKPKVTSPNTAVVTSKDDNSKLEKTIKNFKNSKVSPKNNATKLIADNTVNTHKAEVKDKVTLNNTATASTTTQITQQKPTVVASDVNKNKIKTNVTSNNNPTETNTVAAETTTKNEDETIEAAIEKNKALLEEEKTEVATLNKWSVTPNVAPVYFSSLGKGSSIDAQFNENSKSGEVNMSYGLNASYAITKRLTVRSGINRVNLGYNTNDVVVFSSVNASANAKTLNTLSGNIANNNAQNTAIRAGENTTIMSATAFKSSSIDALNTNNTSINQSFGFIEVPLELQYAISTKRFGINVIGGFSSLFLNNYVSTSIIDGQQVRLQEDTVINNTSYSANFGLGLNYKVSKKINLNLEPLFKYQINTFRNTSGDFQPFFIGVYTGFGIKF